MTKEKSNFIALCKVLKSSFENSEETKNFKVKRGNETHLPYILASIIAGSTPLYDVEIISLKPDASDADENVLQIKDGQAERAIIDILHECFILDKNICGLLEKMGDEETKKLYFAFLKIDNHFLPRLEVKTEHEVVWFDDHVEFDERRAANTDELFFTIPNLYVAFYEDGEPVEGALTQKKEEMMKALLEAQFVKFQPKRLNVIKLENYPHCSNMKFFS